MHPDIYHLSVHVLFNHKHGQSPLKKQVDKGLALLPPSCHVVLENKTHRHLFDDDDDVLQLLNLNNHTSRYYATIGEIFIN